MKLNKIGFTLIELMIVIIIIGVLAAIAAPMMSSNVVRARRSEAVSIMGAIRTAERLYYVDRNTYAAVAAGAWGAADNLNQYIQGNDFNGRYFNSAAFSVFSADLGNTYTIQCAVGVMNTPDVGTNNLYMNANGNIVNY